ncbi:hypothetical protein [Cerasicoccus arenae]|uniref:Uncharacterized protein n=1 Tax=Cerasicoccus arenae TaxID=424488 RepID=A0A8J3GEA7_9BACT|nr:hypothetical protein [Cerasicoccus arenae]MBK1858210.1 hypothetical protein [Cerasicoccus arenae]GHC01925.1 hypothetical protein GCM10007047_17980 [Cerasicoccus arenae]
MAGEKSTTIERTTISIDGKIYQGAKAKAETAGLKFSNYVERLIDADLEGSLSLSAIDEKTRAVIAERAEHFGIPPSALLASAAKGLATYLTQHNEISLPLVVMSARDAAGMDEDSSELDAVNQYEAELSGVTAEKAKRKKAADKRKRA